MSPMGCSGGERDDDEWYWAVVGEMGTHRAEEYPGQDAVSAGADDKEIRRFATQAVPGVTVDNLAGKCDRVVAQKLSRPLQFMMREPAGAGLVVGVGACDIDHRRRRLPRV